jgi:hypothetical protein
MTFNRPAETEIRDLEYSCRFLDRSGDLEAVSFFSSPNDAAAAQEAILQLRDRAKSGPVELWKNDCLLGRYSV